MSCVRHDFRDPGVEVAGVHEPSRSPFYRANVRFWRVMRSL
jgi:hypothetical protein